MDWRADLGSAAAKRETMTVVDRARLANALCIFETAEGFSQKMPVVPGEFPYLSVRDMVATPRPQFDCGVTEFSRGIKQMQILAPWGKKDVLWQRRTTVSTY